MERFAHKRAAATSKPKEFISDDVKIKGQVENIGVDKIEENELIGFKCLHYSVTENNGFVELIVLKK